MVAMQLDDYCQEFARHAASQGMDPKKVNWQAYRQFRLNEAERAVRSGYLLQAIGNAESIEVPEEDIDAEVRELMEQNQIHQPFEAFKADLDQRGGTTEIKGRLRTDRIFEQLLSLATISEELLDRASYDALVELERRREAGLPVNRYDAGGLEGGDLEDQEGGDPAQVAAAEHVHGPDCDHDHAPEPEAPVKKKAPRKAAEPAGEAKPKARKATSAE